MCIYSVNAFNGKNRVCSGHWKRAVILIKGAKKRKHLIDMSTLFAYFCYCLCLLVLLPATYSQLTGLWNKKKRKQSMMPTHFACSFCFKGYFTLQVCSMMPTHLACSFCFKVNCTVEACSMMPIWIKCRKWQNTSKPPPQQQIIK